MKAKNIAQHLDIYTSNISTSNDECVSRSKKRKRSSKTSKKEKRKMINKSKKKNK